jgi:hypothetical protein
MKSPIRFDSPEAAGAEALDSRVRGRESGNDSTLADLVLNETLY